MARSKRKQEPAAASEPQVALCCREAAQALPPARCEACRGHTLDPVVIGHYHGLNSPVAFCRRCVSTLLLEAMKAREEDSVTCTETGCDEVPGRCEDCMQEHCKATAETTCEACEDTVAISDGVTCYGCYLDAKRGVTDVK